MTVTSTTERTGAKCRKQFAVRFVVAPESDGAYSALCLEYNVAGFGDSPKAALVDAIHATIAYLEYFLDRRKKVPPRPADVDLIAEFIGLDLEKRAFTREEVTQALDRVLRVSAQLLAPLKYSTASNRLTGLRQGISPAITAGTYPVSICVA